MDKNEKDALNKNKEKLYGIYSILRNYTGWHIMLNNDSTELTINTLSIATADEKGIYVGFRAWHKSQYNHTLWYRNDYLTLNNVNEWLFNLQKCFGVTLKSVSVMCVSDVLEDNHTEQNEVEHTEKPKLPPQDNSNSNSNSNSTTSNNSSTNNTKPKVKHYYYTKEERKQIGELLSKYSKELTIGEYPLMYQGKCVIGSTGNINNDYWYKAKTGALYDWSKYTKEFNHNGFKSVHLSTENITEFIILLENVFGFKISNKDKQTIYGISEDNEYPWIYKEDNKIEENTIKLQQCKIEEKPHKGERKMKNSKNSKIMKMMAMQQMMGNKDSTSGNNTFDPTMLLCMKDDLDLPALGIKTGNVPNSGVGLNGEVIINDTAINFDEKDEPIMTTGVGELKIDIELMFIPCDIKQLNKKDIIQLDDDYVIVREVTGNKIYGTTIKGYEVAHTLSNNIMGMSYVSKVVNPFQGSNNDNNSFNPMLFALLGDE